MKSTARAQRARDIETTAFAILEERGFDGLTMGEIARRAKASNETLYRWYGDKSGLYKALILRNAEIVSDALDRSKGHSAPDILQDISPSLLAMLLGPSAIALNRAAAADPSGELGRLLAESGRGTVGPWIAAVMAKGLQSGAFSGGPPREMAETFITLLVGDLQIRRATRALPAPDSATVKHRAQTAFLQFSRLFPPVGALDESGRAP